MVSGKAPAMDTCVEWHSRLESTFKSEDVRIILQELFNTVQKECTEAAVRHNDIMSRVLNQQQAFNQQFSEFRRDLSAHIPIPTVLPKCAPVAPVAPMAPDALMAPDIELRPTIFTSDRSLHPAASVINHTPPAAHFTSTSEEGSIAIPHVQFSTDSAKNGVREHETQETQDQQLPRGDSHHTSVSKSALMLSDNSKLRSSGVLKVRSWSGFRYLLEAVVTHSRFEGSVASLIMANALVLCFEVQYNGLQIGYDLKYTGCESEALAIWPTAHTAFIILDWMFGIVFLLEAAMKLTCFVWRYFTDPWNWLDFSCVLGFFLEKFAAEIVPFDAKAVRLLRFLRLIRVVRVLRTLESLDQLYIMTTAIQGMCMVVFWAVILLSVILMAEALFLTQFLHAYYFKDSLAVNLSEKQLASQHTFYEYFGSFTRCLLSMFELTLANWPPVTRLLSEEVSEMFMPLCLAHKLAIGFAVVGVINGVILQETFKVALQDDWIMMRQRKRAQETSRKKMTALFQTLQRDVDGELDWGEFSAIAEIPEIKTWLASMDVETDDLRALFAVIDEDSSGYISLEELVRRVPRVKGVARCIDLLELKRDLLEIKRDQGIIQRN